MKKTTILTALFVIMAVFTAKSQTAVQPAGDGTSGNPYQIATLDNLYWLSQADTAWDKNYIQTANIDATSTNTWDSGAGFSPIGNGTTDFTGIYNGGGYTIDSLFINRETENSIGLFGSINHSEIDSLGVLNVNIKGKGFTGALVGFVQFSIVNNCYSTGTIVGGELTGGYSYSGGLIGRINGGSTVFDSYSTANISSDYEYIGGFSGFSDGATVYNCYATGNVTVSEGCTGGFVGANNGSYGEIYNCYATGSVSGTYSGGFVGLNDNDATIYNCYSTGTVTLSSSGTIGGFVCNGNNGTVTNCFWDTETSGQISSDGGTGKTTAEMQTLSTFTDATWDFVGETTNGTDDYWDMNACLSDYPTLWWQVFETPIGSGTTADPYQIATLEDLRWLSKNSCVWDKNFIQTEDINASETHNWNISGTDTLGFSPIGNNTTNFTGTYDGQGHIIDNLFINRTSTNYTGLFGTTYTCYIYDIGVTNADITGVNYTACIVGWLNGIVENSFSNGVVYGNSYSGGLVGSSYGTINNSYSNANVSGPNNSSSLGGLLGSNGGSGSISNSYSTGFVTNGYSGIGGLVGYQQSGASTSNSFWNTETSGQATSAGGTGLTTAEMQQMCVYADSSWDFMFETINGTENIWGLNANENGGYPFLAWQGYTHTESCCGYVDLDNPTITCVTNQTVSADATHNYTVAGTEFDPTANNDNCGVANIVNDFNNSSTLDGESLPEGTTTITWTVIDDSGNFESCSFDILVDNYVRINTISQNKTKIYPNPAFNQLTISNEQLIIESITILDITGKTVLIPSLRGETTSQSVNIEDLKQGIHFIKLTTNNSTEVLQFVKR